MSNQISKNRTYLKTKSKRYILLFVVAVFCLNIALVPANSETDYEINYTKKERYWDKGYEEYGKAIVIDDENNVYVSGVHETLTPYLVKFDNNLNELWNFSYYDVSTHANNQRMVCSSNGSLYNICETNFLCDLNGNFIWKKDLYLRSCETSQHDACITKNDEIVIGGHITNTYNYGFMYKMDKDGQEIWNVTWCPADESCFVYSVAVDSTGNNYATISSYVLADSNHQKLYMVKFDSSGAQLWNKTLSDNENDMGSLVAISESYEIFTISNRVVTAGIYSLILRKISSSDGNVVWEKTYENQGYTRKFRMYNDTLLFVTDSINYGYDDLFYIANLTGDIQYSDVIELENGADETIYDLTMDENDNIFLLGSKMNPITKDFDVYIIKYSPNNGDGSVPGFNIFFIICSIIAMAKYTSRKIHKKRRFL